ncbi:MAG: hypothetical protein WCC84_03365 [Candidatus Cybelea sp.]
MLLPAGVRTICAALCAFLALGACSGVRYTIGVPADASVRINKIAGMVVLAGVRGDITIQTQAGAIKAKAGRVAGSRSIDINATTGAIALRQSE